MTHDSEKCNVYIGANSDVGLFYGLQTLKQLIVGQRICQASIADRPTLETRGIPMGLQWFNERKGEVLERLTSLKFNMVWTHGSFLNNYARTDNWRLPFSPSQKASLKEFHDLYQQSFIDVWISLGPRGKKQPLQYSSDADIDIVADKMGVLYDLGFRKFGLAFDDLANTGEDVLLVQEDIDVFDNSIGLAQVHFIGEVYHRLTQRHANIEFMVLPMDYNQCGNYSDETGRNLRFLHELPIEVNLYCVTPYDEDVLAGTYLTGRSRLMIWDNFYAGSFGSLPDYVVPYPSFINWKNPHIGDRIDGFTWLPATPSLEDAAHISWRTAADFAWAPDRYEADRSFQLAAAQHLGVSDQRE